MRQAWHIFRKDARRLWPEILISLVIVAAFVRLYPAMWMPDAGPFGGAEHTTKQLQILASVLTGLVPVSWWVLVARVVHGESLVGDRQFWVTRPYEWQQLLGAKLLFVVVFVYLPFIAAQCALLVEGGFQPQGYVPGLLFNLLLVTGIVVVPLFALAAVTANFVRMALTVLVIVVAVAGIAWLSSLSQASGVSTPYEDRFSIPVVLLVGGAAIVVQYARRRVVLARMILLTIPVVIGALAMGLPTPGMVDAAYPEAQLSDAGGSTAAILDSPVRFSYSAEPIHPGVVRAAEAAGQVELTIPVQVEGVSAGHAVEVDDLKATLTAPDGRQRVVPWKTVYNHRFLPGGYEGEFTLEMKRAIFDQFKGGPVAVGLTFAVTETRAGEPIAMKMPDRDFTVPGFGVCSVDGLRASGYRTGSFDCRFAMHGPDLTHVTASGLTRACVEDGTQETAEPTAEAWMGSLGNDPADFGLTPVWSVPAYFNGTNRTTSPALCPGTELRFTRYTLVRRRSVTLMIPKMQWPAEAKDSGGLELRLKQ